LNTQDATAISFRKRHPDDHILKTPLSGDFV